MKLEQLRKKYFDLLDEAKALVTKAETEKRNLDVNETNDYDTKINEAETIKKQIRAMEKANELEENEVRHVEHAEPKKSAWNSFGEFLRSVQRAETQREIDPRLETRASGLNETVPSEGGFLVPAQHVPELLKKTYENSAVAKLARKIQASGNSVTINRVAETSRATGSRWGAVQAYWLNEGGTKTDSKPAFGRMQLTLKKLIGMCYATDELLEDTTALESVINEAFPSEFAWMVDDALINGTGAGQPLGVMNAPCLVTVAKEAGQPADTLMYENVVKMWARMWAKSRSNAVWFINQDVEPQLHAMSLAVGVGGVPVYMPAGGIAGTPYSTLFGRPIVPIEQCQTLGTTGDIILADFSQYLMIEKGGIKTDTSIHVKFVYDETAFRFVYRCDGQPMWPSVLTPAKGTNTLSPFVALADR
jgi:HK97 family phage major capsid protein